MIDFEEYIKQGEPSRKEKARIWQTAIGLQDVDGLKPSNYLIENAKENIEGKITIFEVKDRISTYYKTRSFRNTDTDEDDRTEEADKVSSRITEILSNRTFSFSPVEYTNIHKRLYALVRANYNDFQHNIKSTTEYLMYFFGNLLLGENNILKNRDLLVGTETGNKIQSAKAVEKAQ